MKTKNERMVTHFQYICFSNSIAELFFQDKRSLFQSFYSINIPSIFLLSQEYFPKWSSTKDLYDLKGFKSNFIILQMTQINIWIIWNLSEVCAWRIWRSWRRGSIILSWTISFKFTFTFKILRIFNIPLRWLI